MKVIRDEGGAIVDYDESCCALPQNHDGECAYVCHDCHGTTRCWACGGYDPGDDLGTGCTECDGWGHCTSCHEGLVAP